MDNRLGIYNSRLFKDIFDEDEYYINAHKSSELERKIVQYDLIDIACKFLNDNLKDYENKE